MLAVVAHARLIYPVAKSKNMPQRKGQFIVNHIRFKALPETFPKTVHMKDGALTYDCSKEEFDQMMVKYLFNMRDEEFTQLELEYRKYIIPYIHGVKNRDEEIEQVSAQGRMALDMMEKDIMCEHCHEKLKYGEDHVSLKSRNETWHLECYQKAEKNR